MQMFSDAMAVAAAMQQQPRVRQVLQLRNSKHARKLQLNLHAPFHQPHFVQLAIYGSQHLAQVANVGRESLHVQMPASNCAAHHITQGLGDKDELYNMP
jgi:hypothetical protein